MSNPSAPPMPQAAGHDELDTAMKMLAGLDMSADTAGKLIDFILTTTKAHSDAVGSDFSNTDSSPLSSPTSLSLVDGPSSPSLLWEADENDDAQVLPLPAGSTPPPSAALAVPVELPAVLVEASTFVAEAHSATLAATVADASVNAADTLPPAPVIADAPVTAADTLSMAPVVPDAPVATADTLPAIPGLTNAPVAVADTLPAAPIVADTSVVTAGSHPAAPDAALVATMGSLPAAPVVAAPVVTAPAAAPIIGVVLNAGPLFSPTGPSHLVGEPGSNLHVYENFVFEMPEDNAPGPFYLVTKGRRVGVFSGWHLTSPYVIGVSCASFRRVPSRQAGLAQLIEAIDQSLAEWLR